MWDAEYRDPRLVEVYDAECLWGPDDDFFVSVVGSQPVRVRVDLGCGTGRLTLGLAALGHTVTGVDPAIASLDAARAKPHAESVTWIEGTSADLPDAAFDIAVMTSHVAQLFVDDAVWMQTLTDLHRALVPGGRLTFESRDPNAREWERWNPVDSRRTATLADGTVVHSWTEVTNVVGECVTFAHHNQMPSGDDLESTATLRFRTAEELCASVANVGFEVDATYGGSQREPVGQGNGEHLVIAHR